MHFHSWSCTKCDRFIIIIYYVQSKLMYYCYLCALHFTHPFKWVRQRAAFADAHTLARNSNYMLRGREKRPTENKSNRTHHCEHTTFVVGFIVVVDHFVGFLFSLSFHFIWFFVSNALSQVDLFCFSRNVWRVRRWAATTTANSTNKHRQE